MKNHYNYISKAPCGKDLFAGKTHEKTAEQITKKILSSETSLIIGIDGGWGSGKSNLIQMIEERVQEQEAKAIFFTYDAWGHQNDMPRRAMLEELTSKVIQFPQALLEDKREDWEERKEKLLAKRKKTSTKTIPKISMGVLVFALMTVATPTFSELGKIGPEKWAPCWNRFVPALPLLLGLSASSSDVYAHR